MKRFTMILALVLLTAMNAWAQNFNYGKIAPDLLQDINASSKSGELFRTIIIMDEQFDAQKSTRQMQYLSKAQQREFVVDELQRISANGQKGILKDLQIGQKACLVNDIRTYWIFNGISCSMTRDMVQAIAERPDVKLVMKDITIHIIDGKESEPIEIEKDRANIEWNVTRVNADDVWAMGYTGSGIIVAVIDTGVNYNHTDIADNMWDGGDEFPHHGWDFLNDDNDPMDDHSHGTHCAGTVSSYGTNGKQCGIAKDAKIMALKTLGSEGGRKSFTWAAIQFAVSHGADILSMSLGVDGAGGEEGDRIIMENVLHCGVVAAVAAGNTGNKYEDGHLKYPVPYNVGSPGNCPSPWRHPDQILEGGHTAVVTVGSTTSNDIRSSFSAFGPSTWTEGDYIGVYYDYPWVENDPVSIGLIKPDIVAPGSNINSLYYNSNTEYTSKSGTSMATPCVAGVMALMLQANPTLTPVEIDSIIEITAVPCENQTSKNNYYGSGRIDAYAAINYMINVCEAPTNLQSNVNGFNVTLSWTPASGVETYRVYRNGAMIARSVAGTTYTDVNAPAGSNTYFVRSNGNNYQASLPSNSVTENVTTSHTPANLIATDIDTNNSTVELSWNKLYYSHIGTNYILAGDRPFIAAQRFPSEILQAYGQMEIEHLFFGVKEEGSVCTIKFYEGDEMQPGTLIYEGEYTSIETKESIDYVLDEPLIINPNKALWVTISSTGSLLVDSKYKSNTNGDAFIYRYQDGIFWDSYLDWAWSFQLGINNGNDYSYNIYCNNTLVSNQNETSYTTTFDEGMNKYQVTATTNDYESSTSNAVMIVKTAAATNDLTLGTNDQLIVLPNSTFTVSGTLSNSNPNHLVLEDGAQLIHNSDNVAATVKKEITSYNDGEDWNFIASPVMEKIIPSSSNGLLLNDYDLYFYDEPFHMWRNHKEHLVDNINQNEASNFNIEYKKGYLYANSAATTLQFAGTLTRSDNGVGISDLSHSASILNGFNLVGNPLVCNATIDQDCYVIDDNRVVLASNTKIIAPCEGVFVKATSNEFTVTFSKHIGAKANRNGKCLDLVVTQGRAIIDRARVRLGKGIGMEKLKLDDDNGSKLTLWHDGQDLAVAYANNQTELPLNFKVSQNNTYTLGIETENLDLDYLHLIDNLTGNDIDLLASPNYTFEAKTTDYVSRFRLVFASVCEDTDGGNENFAFINDGNIIVYKEGIIQIIDMTGRIVLSGDAINRVSTSGMTPGVYVLRLITANGMRTQKIIID